MNSTIFLVLAALLVAMATSADAVTCNEACATQYPAGGVFSLSKKQTALCTETCMFAIKAISADKQDPTSPFKGESAADAAAKADASKGSLWAKHDWGGDVAKAAGKVSVAAINEVCKSGASVSKSSMQACQTGAILGSVAAASSTMQSSTKNQLMRAGVQGCTSWCNVNSGADYDGDDNTLVTKDLNTWSSFGSYAYHLCTSHCMKADNATSLCNKLYEWSLFNNKDDKKGMVGSVRGCIAGAALKLGATLTAQ